MLPLLPSEGAEWEVEKWCQGLELGRDDGTRKARVPTGALRKGPFPSGTGVKEKKHHDEVVMLRMGMITMTMVLPGRFSRSPGNTTWFRAALTIFEP